MVENFISILSDIEKRITGCTDPEINLMVEKAFYGTPEERFAICSVADRMRRTFKGDGIFVMGLVKFSNFCRGSCACCGISAEVSGVSRYRLDKHEIVASARLIRSLGIGTIVLQSGEDFHYSPDCMARIISEVKQETALEVTVSAGERDDKTLELWKKAGMDRYLLKFETSSRDLFSRFHPDGDLDGRIGRIRSLQNFGVETGSGFLMGLPGAGPAETAADIALCRDLCLHMIGACPFIPSPGTHLADHGGLKETKVAAAIVAILRIVCPRANIPSIAALGAISPQAGRLVALRSGANVVMPNFTPGGHCADYAFYPGKPFVPDAVTEILSQFAEGAKSMGRHLILGSFEMAASEIDPAEVHSLFCIPGWCVESEGKDLSWAGRMLSGSFLLAGFRVNGRLAAFGRALSDGVCDAYIQDVVVHPDFRLRGLGREIVTVLASGLRARGITWIALVAAPGTENFYNEAGFKVMEGHLPMLRKVMI